MDKTLWKEEVAINSDWTREDWKFMLNCLNETTISLHNYGRRGILQGEMEMIVGKCPNLQEFMTVLDSGQNSWMMLQSPWISLEVITLSCLRFGRIFQGIKLEETLPHIVMFIITEHDAHEDRDPSVFPDLSGCQHLTKAVFLHGYFRFGKIINSGEKLPLPLGLKTLNLYGCRFHEGFMNNISYKDMKKIIPTLKTFEPCNK